MSFKTKVFVEDTEEELLEMDRSEVTLDLSEKEMRFCEQYVRNYNLKMSAIKAGYKKEYAHLTAYRLRRRYNISRYLAWLKVRVSSKCMIKAENIIEKYTRIAFADILDFITIKDNRIKLNNGEDVDGQLIKTVKQGRDGVTIELHDKLAALEKLEKYFDCMPKDWRQKIEEKRLEILEERLKLDKDKAGYGLIIDEDDGFIEALKGEVKSIWE